MQNYFITGDEEYFEDLQKYTKNSTSNWSIFKSLHFVPKEVSDIEKINVSFRPEVKVHPSNFSKFGFEDERYNHLIKFFNMMDPLAVISSEKSNHLKMICHFP